MTDIIRALNSIGKKCFVDYFWDFKNCNDKQMLAEKLLNDNSHAFSLSAQITRINYAIWIFDNKLEKEALELIIESKRINKATLEKAKAIMSLL